jgi:hypothetical protein
MDQDKVILWAEAKRLNIPDYRKVSLDELRTLIAKAKRSGSTPAKGKATATSTNGAKGKPAARTAVKRTVTPAKGKSSAAPVKGKGKPAATTTAKSAPAKSTVRKPAAKRTAAPGTAKRPTTGGKGKATAVRQARATAAKPRTRTTKPKDSYRVTIDNKSVNWKLPSNVGQSGKRKVVLDSLRANKGDKGKVFAEVKRYATKWYPDKDKNAADRMVVWLIGRVALDYVKLTGQHESGVRVGYGESTKPNDIRRREQRAAARKAATRTTRTRAAAKPAAGKRAPAKGKAAPAARKPAQRRTAAPRARGKATATATTLKGKGRR